MKIKETIAVVTGGASGLGEATARDFAAGGARVAIFDMNADQGREGRRRDWQAGDFARVDVASEDASRPGIAAAIKEFGAINANVNCAGIGVAMKTMGKEGPHVLDLSRR